MNIWIEKTIVKGREDRLEGERSFGKVIWSPKTGSDGRDTYKNMRLVKPGDYILHFIDNKEFAGISLVESNLREVNGLSDSQWDTDSYLFNLSKYTPLEKPLDRNSILNEKNKDELKSISAESEVFYQANLNLRQGAYLTPCPNNLFELVNSIYQSENNKELPFYNTISEKENTEISYWLYSPGEYASKWEEFYEQGIMGLGWDEIGDLRQYQNKAEIKKALVEANGGDGSKKNNVSANDDFLNKLKIGDVVIVKKGRGSLLGYGIVTSDYYFDTDRSYYNSCRKVDWKLKGNWEVDFKLVVKTLTDITKYSSDDLKYDKYYQKLLTIMGQKIEPKKLEDMNFPLNTILYGPPGTGKTYNTILRAAQIIENRKIDFYEEALEIFKKNLHGKIEFITFHQNYSYEDFIQGLRPDTENDSQLTFERKDGVFKKIADKALENIRLSEKPPAEISNEVQFSMALDKFQDIILESEGSYSINDTAYIFEIEEDAFRYTGEKWTNHSNGLRMKFSDLKEFYRHGVKSRKDIKELNSISGLAKQHATYYFLVYEQITNLLPEKIESPTSIEKENYVIIIDEINRANISRVFGELITLIEPDKRYGGSLPLEARLPSGDPFIVPQNLYIIGTMNTADKSIALLDIALRRRFEFESMYPKYEIENQTIYDVDILKEINKQIIKSKGHDFQIGHAYFMGDNKDLIERMNKKIIPLLLEYYMNDEKEVKGILQSANLKIEEASWPLKISGIND